MPPKFHLRNFLRNWRKTDHNIPTKARLPNVKITVVTFKFWATFVTSQHKIIVIKSLN